MEIIARIVFGVDLSDQVSRLRDAVHVFRAAMQKQMSNPLSLPDWLPLPGKIRRRRTLRNVDDLIWDLIRAESVGPGRRRHAGPDAGGGRQVGPRFPYRGPEIRDEAATLFVAGHDTTSASLAWFWYILSQNPAVERRVIQEVDAAVGRRTPTFEDLPRLKYLERTVKEAMRMYPASGFLFGRQGDRGRRAGRLYPEASRTWVFISPYAVHHDPKIFKDPEKCDPEHFSPGASTRFLLTPIFPSAAGPAFASAPRLRPWRWYCSPLRSCKSIGCT